MSQRSKSSILEGFRISSGISHNNFRYNETKRLSLLAMQNHYLRNLVKVKLERKHLVHFALAKLEEVRTSSEQEDNLLLLLPGQTVRVDVCTAVRHKKH